nr:hypothetical protein [Tanacetum cinerariifolium]
RSCWSQQQTVGDVVHEGGICFDELAEADGVFKRGDGRDGEDG